MDGECLFSSTNPLFHCLYESKNFFTFGFYFSFISLGQLLNADLYAVQMDVFVKINMGQTGLLRERGHLCVLLQWWMQSPWQHCAPAAKSWEDGLVPTHNALARTHCPCIFISRVPHFALINPQVSQQALLLAPSGHLELEQERMVMEVILPIYTILLFNKPRLISCFLLWEETGKGRNVERRNS